MVSDSAGGLAGGLTRGLALAAAALSGSFSEISLVDSLDVLHSIISFRLMFKYLYWFNYSICGIFLQ